jgi:serine/threonine-protein kinase
MPQPDPSLVRGLADRYRIGDSVGEGGMATVYEAEDLRHNRRVAIKVLRPELAAVVGGERFLKEIEVTANLHHPHILGLIDSGAVEGRLYYVMPFMEGESLRAKLERERQLPVEDAVRIASEVAAALGYAHRQGVVHRDIKPENILLQDGHAMVADFGIALAVSEAAGQRITATGLSMGTPQYMSPEQAAGDVPVDGRTDTYALGCVVYEMLTGVPPFTGRTAQAVLSAVMTTDPLPVRQTRATVPDHLAAAVRTALEKVPADRFQDAQEFVHALRGPTARTSARMTPAAGTAVRRRSLVPAVTVGAAALALALGVVIGQRMGGGEAAHDPVRHFDLLLPTDAPVALTGPGPLGFWQPAVALAPDGDRMAYVARSGGTTVLAVRPLDQDTAMVLPGTEGAYHPFFSPDGAWIGYFATLTTVDRPTGAAWPEEDEILLFQQDGFEMRRVPAAGGQGSSVLLPAQFGAPTVLPGGSAAVGQMGTGQLGVLSLSDTSLRAVTRRGVIPLDSVRLDDLLIGYSPKYVDTGHLLFGSEDGQLLALPFNGAALAVRGGAVPMVDGVRIEEGFGFAQYDIGPDGTLVFVPGRSQLFGELAYVGEAGALDTIPLPRGHYTQPRMSPDGRRLAVQQRMPVGGWRIVLHDLESGVTQRLPFEENYRVFPAAWGADGGTLLVGLFHPAANAFQKARLYTFASGSWLDVSEPIGSYMSIAPNGIDVVYSDFRTGELFVRPLLGDAPPVAIPGRGFAASYSPDGRWLAWGDVNGGVTVSPLPPTGAVYRVAERGQQPIWTSNGRAVLYRDGRRFYEITLDFSDGVRTAPPRLLAEGPFLRTFAWNHTISPDGRLVAIVSTPGDQTSELGVITGFDRMLARLAPPQGDS